MIKTFTLTEISKVAKDIIKDIKKNNNEGAMIVALSGDLGAGKTTLTKEIAKLMGIKKEIVSPTFVIMKKYNIKNTKFKYLIHIDAYRLKNGEDLKNLGWQDLSSNKENLIILEWPEIVLDCLVENKYEIKLEHKDEKTRSIEICYN